MTKLRQAASRPSGCQRMTSSGCRHLRVSSFLSFKIKNGSLENAHRALASYLTSLKIVIQPSVGKQWSIVALNTVNRNIKKSVSAPIGGKDNGLGGSWAE